MKIEVSEKGHYLFGKKFDVKKEWESFYVVFSEENDTNIMGEITNKIAIISKFRAKIVQEYQQKLF